MRTLNALPPTPPPPKPKKKAVKQWVPIEVSQLAVGMVVKKAIWNSPRTIYALTHRVHVMDNEGNVSKYLFHGHYPWLMEREVMVDV